MSARFHCWDKVTIWAYTRSLGFTEYKGELGEIIETPDNLTQLYRVKFPEHVHDAINAASPKGLLLFEYEMEKVIV